MNIELKKLTRSIYLTIGIISLSLLLLSWFLTHSFITIQLSPSNAKIFLDDKQIATNGGKAKNFITPGPHTVRIEALGHIGLSQEINFKHGLAKKIKVTLKPLPEPFSVAENAEFLNQGTNFNSFYYLDTEKDALYLDHLKLENDQVSSFSKLPITAPTLSDINEIIWSPSHQLALFRKSDGINLFDFKKYDFVNQTEEAWGKNVGSIAWAPDNSKIAYYYGPPSGERSLIFANTTNTEVNRVFNFNDLGITNPLLRWSPDSEWLLIVPRNEDSSGNKIYLFNAYSRKITEIADTGNHLDANFSPDGNKILYSTYSKDAYSPVNSVLSIMNKDGSDKRSLDIRAELKKTTWNKDSINIVVASYDADTQRESIYRFDTETKEKNGFIIKDLGDIFIQSVAMSDDNKIVVYQDNTGISAVATN